MLLESSLYELFFVDDVSCEKSLKRILIFFAKSFTKKSTYKLCRFDVKNVKRAS